MTRLCMHVTSLASLSDTQESKQWRQPEAVSNVHLRMRGTYEYVRILGSEVWCLDHRRAAVSAPLAPHTSCAQEAHSAWQMERCWMRVRHVLPMRCVYIGGLQHASEVSCTPGAQQC